MQQGIQHSEPVPPTEPTTSRLRTVTGNRFPRKCACGCGLQIPRDPEVRYVVDFGAAKPYPAYLREHSPDYGTYRGKPLAPEDSRTLPGFVPASKLPRPEPPAKQPVAPRPAVDVAHENAEGTAGPEAGRAWASGQLVFNAGQFESARSGFSDYARDGETAKELRARVNRTILDDLEDRAALGRFKPVGLSNSARAHERYERDAMTPLRVKSDGFRTCVEPYRSGTIWRTRLVCHT